MVEIIQLIVLGIGILVITGLYLLSHRALNKQKSKQRRSIYRKGIRALYVVAIIVFVAIVLGYNVTNIWITLGSVLGLVAIGFVAVWSLLGNILSAVILFITQPFKIESHIRFCESGIEGVVEEISWFYTILQDKKGNYIHIPNTAFFQKEFMHIVEKK